MHEARTGKKLRVTEADVANEEMYEEIDNTPLNRRYPMAHLRTGHMPLDFRFQAFFNTQLAMRAQAAVLNGNDPNGQAASMAQQAFPTTNPQYQIQAMQQFQQMQQMQSLPGTQMDMQAYGSATAAKPMGNQMYQKPQPDMPASLQATAQSNVPLNMQSTRGIVQFSGNVGTAAPASPQPQRTSASSHRASSSRASPYPARPSPSSSIPSEAGSEGQRSPTHEDLATRPTTSRRASLLSQPSFAPLNEGVQLSNGAVSNDTHNVRKRPRNEEEDVVSDASNVISAGIEHDHNKSILSAALPPEAQQMMYGSYQDTSFGSTLMAGSQYLAQPGSDPYSVPAKQVNYGQMGATMNGLGSTLAPSASMAQFQNEKQPPAYYSGLQSTHDDFSFFDLSSESDLTDADFDQYVNFDQSGFLSSTAGFD